MLPLLPAPVRRLGIKSPRLVFPSQACFCPPLLLTLPFTIHAAHGQILNLCESGSMAALRNYISMVGSYVRGGGESCHIDTDWMFTRIVEGTPIADFFFFFFFFWLLLNE